jgi:hypothetical protein
MNNFSAAAVSAVTKKVLAEMEAKKTAEEAIENKEAGLVNIEKPDTVYADLTRREYLDFKENYSDFEKEQIQKAKNDTSLIDAAKEDSKLAQDMSQGVVDRQANRYGASLTPAQVEEQKRALQRGSQLGATQAINNSRIAQKEANTALMSDLINIGQGVNRASQNQLGSAAADATQRKNAYEQARAQSKAQTYSTVASLGGMALMALAF